MKFLSAIYDAFGSISVTIENQPEGTTITIPDDMANRDRQDLAEWEAEGNIIEPYVEPPPPVEGGDLMQDMPVTRAEFDALEARVTNLEEPI